MTQPIPGVTTANPFGQDFAIILTNGVLDFYPDMRLASGRTLLIQSLLCRQLTSKGTVIDCPNDAFDLRDFVSVGMTQAQISQLGTMVQNELLKDERVIAANVGAVYNQGTLALTLTEFVQSGYGPFTLVLNVTNVTVELLDQNLPQPITLVTGSTGSNSLA